MYQASDFAFQPAHAGITEYEARLAQSLDFICKALVEATPVSEGRALTAVRAMCVLYPAKANRSLVPARDALAAATKPDARKIALRAAREALFRFPAVG